MTFGPACERCGCNSYEGSQDEPVICPFCRKPKRRGSRKELVAVLNDAKLAMVGAVGFLVGASISSAEAVKTRLIECVKAIDDI